jgi:hypothetical protein
MGNLAVQSERRRKVSVCFAAGVDGHAYSSIWRLWAAKNSPDLYLMVRGMSEIKASVHCPTPSKPTWKRHFGFDYDARGDLSDAIREAGESRHKVGWVGANIGHGRTIEWRILVRGPSLLCNPQLTFQKTELVHPPRAQETLIFTVSLGSPHERTEFPKAADAQTYLIKEGTLVDGRQFWVTYCYAPLITPPFPANEAKRHISSKSISLTGASALRVLTPHPNEDGSLAFFEWRAVIKNDSLQLR